MLGLAGGIGAVAGGLVVALIGFLVRYIGLGTGGLVIAGMGALIAIVAAIGFALHGSARVERPDEEIHSDDGP
ncbi:hypothetical protein DEI81_02445 [Curtobacterium sp. MCBD17_013]|uniref:hypothetical protein n=1 Tax=Curtobacterium sp. MCBD17_013 TaxID=2175668 RepID=UPI000DA81849|nr:hypothetical protein [Curtobacterium sp. MCBD17_013]PZF66475.1 hypothetical protein DEI81_02445 [Curtobacterium sp. MCBD17_013]